MQFRDHPLMTRKSGFCSWPPMWTTTRHDDNGDEPTGEIGILQQVLMNDLFKHRIFIFIDYQGCRYMGSMAFDDERFCSEIYSVLKYRIGYSIKQIGNMDLSYTV
jgi:hypothetical protein